VVLRALARTVSDRHHAVRGVVARRFRRSIEQRRCWLYSLLRPVRTGTVCAGLALAVAPSPAVGSVRLSWSAARLIDRGSAGGSGVSLTGVSCPSVSLCVATDQAGDVVTSTAPTSVARWKVAHVDRGHGWQPTLDGISCPSLALCVTVDDAGDVMTSTAPTAGAAYWKVASVDRSQGSMACRVLRCRCASPSTTSATS
jgi:hypothetical protein